MLKSWNRIKTVLVPIAAGPWTIFAPTNDAFMNLPMSYLENMIRNPSRLSKLILNHMINKSLYKAGLKSHQQVQMANGNILNLYARPGNKQRRPSKPGMGNIRPANI